MTFTPEQSTQRTQPVWATHGTPGAPAPRQGHGGLAATGFGLAVFGLLAGLMPFFGFLVTVPALLLSLAGRRRFRAGAVTESGLSRAGIVMGWIGIGLCTLTTALLIANVEPAPPVQPVQPVAAPAPVPALVVVPNVVGMPDLAARDTLRAAGFTNVVLGPPTASQPGVAAGTVTTQQPGATSLAATGDPIVLGEAAAPPPPAPVVVPQAAAPTTAAAPPTRAARPFVATPDVDADRPYVPAPRVPDTSTSSGGGSSSGDGGAYYKNCAAAKAAGAAPISKGQPGYRSALDRDGDGTACDK